MKTAKKRGMRGDALISEADVKKWKELLTTWTNKPKKK